MWEGRQSKFGTSSVPYSATWIKVSKARVNKFARALEELDAKMAKLQPPGARREQEGATTAPQLPEGAGGGESAIPSNRSIAVDLLAEFDDLEADLLVALSHCRARLLVSLSPSLFLPYSLSRSLPPSLSLRACVRVWRC